MNNKSDHPPESESSLEIRAAWLAYVGGYTQEQIAVRLGVSRIKVQRLIAAAAADGVVKFSVEGAPTACLALEDSLMQQFGLAHCVVVPSLGSDPEGADEIKNLGVAGAKYLARELEAGAYSTVGVGHGRTLAALVQHLPRMQLADTSFVSLIGSLTRRSSANPFDVISTLAQRTASECFFLPVPFMADTEEDADVLRAQRGVQSALALARRSQLCVIGVGDLQPDTYLLKSGTVTPAEYQRLIEDGATGEFVGRFVDAQGQQVAGPMNKRALGLDIGELRGKKVLAVAGGRRKARAIAASLRTGVITALVVDEDTAREVLNQTK